MKTRRPKYYDKTRTNVIRIFRTLKKASEEEGGYLSISEIGRRTGLHRWTISRTIDMWLHGFVDMVIPEELEHVGLRIKLVRLSNPNATEAMVLRSMRIRL